MSVCEHDWCYNNAVLTSYPPQRDRICRKCGKQERVCEEGFRDYHEYSKLIRKFERMKE